MASSRVCWFAIAITGSTWVIQSVLELQTEPLSLWVVIGLIGALIMAITGVYGVFRAAKINGPAKQSWITYACVLAAILSLISLGLG